jgi:ribosomal protein L11 methyltransferase
MTPPFPTHRQARTWLRITLTVAPELSDVVAGFLAVLTGRGVETSTGGSGATIPMARVIGYLPQDDNDKDLGEQLTRIDLFIEALTKQFPDRPAFARQLDTIQEEDWGRNWKVHFKPLPITRRLVIKPTWERYEAGADELVIEMDPGLAFGTGHHASTRLALTLIDEIFAAAGTKPARALDVGTGTGILAMGCALFGSREVIAIDNDPDAVAAAKDNVAANHLEKIVSVSGDDLASLDGPFDLISANITRDVLRELAPDLVRLLTPGGRLILAGILRNGQDEAIVRQYTGLGLVHDRTTTKDEWAALVFHRDEQ